MQETPFIKTSQHKPPIPGWYKTRREHAPALNQPQKRWWSGATWSHPVYPDDSDNWALRCGRTDAVQVLPELGEIEWSGLAAPHPEWNLDWQEIRDAKPRDPANAAA